MIDNVIVTVNAENQAFVVDMELPANIPVKELAPKLLETLKEIEPGKFRRLEKLSLICDGVILPDSSTLESEAVWDGKILIVR
ncbi:MAG: hypothetical protein GX154_08785 [Clostridiales bacterium]|nr:hypothetical protein [Clostridiales bacterium]